MYVRVCMYICVSYLYFKTFFYDLCVLSISVIHPTLHFYVNLYWRLLLLFLLTEMNCVFTDHDYFSCYKNDVSLCFLESRIIAVSASVFCWLYPTINKVYLILSYLILSYLTVFYDIYNISYFTIHVCVAGYLAGREDYYNHTLCGSMPGWKPPESTCGVDLHQNTQVVWNNTEYSSMLYARKAREIVDNHDPKKVIYLSCKNGVRIIGEWGKWEKIAFMNHGE